MNTIIGTKSPDFGVRIPRRERTGITTLSDEDVVRLIGREESARLNFVAMMLEGIAMQMISEWIDLCRQSRRKEYRVYTRPMCQAIEAYATSVSDFWKDHLYIYEHYLRETMRESVRQREIHYRLGMSNEVWRQLPPSADRDTALILAFTVLMLRRAEDVDNDRLQRLQRATGGRIVVKSRDHNVRHLIDACERMQRDLHLEVSPTKVIKDVISSFYTNISCFCIRLLSEEMERERQTKSLE